MTLAKRGTCGQGRDGGVLTHLVGRAANGVLVSECGSESWTAEGDSASDSTPCLLCGHVCFLLQL